MTLLLLTRPLFFFLRPGVCVCVSNGAIITAWSFCFQWNAASAGAEGERFMMRQRAEESPIIAIVDDQSK